MKDTWIVTRQNPPENSKPKKIQNPKKHPNLQKKGFLSLSILAITVNVVLGPTGWQDIHICIQTDKHRNL